MAETALERILHYKCPEWGNSIRSARSETGFSFKLQDNELWEWLVSGGHEKVKNISDREVRKLGVEEFIEYYICCFYSNYERQSGIIDFKEIKGPPWVELKCPATNFGAAWNSSIQNSRKSIDAKLGQEEGLASGNISHTFLSWYFNGGGAEEVAELAIKEVQRLGMAAVNSLLWVCCLAPEKVYRMVDRSGLLYKSFPQLIDWDRFSLKCPNREVRRRFRAYPAGIDWSEGSNTLDNHPGLTSRLGIHYHIMSSAGSTPTLNVRWDPLIATSATEVAAAVRELHKYYETVYRPRMLENMQKALETIIRQKRKGGHPELGAEKRKRALKCARLKDEEGFTYLEIAKRFRFHIEEDSYGKLSQSSEARRYVKLGRELRRAQNSRKA